MFALLIVPAAYVIGSLSPSWIIARLTAGVDLRKEGNGRVSATAVQRHAGWLYFLLAMVLDVGKGASAIFACLLVTDNQWIILAAGLAVVVGHCWSVFLRFNGGLGATVIYGVLLSIVLWQFLMGALGGLIIFLSVKKSTLATAIAIAVTSVAVFIMKGDLVLSLYPLLLLLAQFTKRFSISGDDNSEYKNDLMQDLKRKKDSIE